MTKTALEVIERAHRRIRVLAVDDEPTAEMDALGNTVLQGLLDEIGATTTIAFTIDTVPDNAFLGMADLLAVELAPEYNRPPPSTRGYAWSRLMSVLRPSDIEDRRDTDDDGTVSDDEEEAGLRAQFY